MKIASIKSAINSRLNAFFFKIIEVFLGKNQEYKTYFHLSRLLKIRNQKHINQAKKTLAIKSHKGYLINQLNIELFTINNYNN